MRLEAGYGKAQLIGRIGVASWPRRSVSVLAGLVALIAVSSVVGVVPAQAEPMPNGIPGTWTLVLNEEFSANGLNTALWTPEWPTGAMSGECTSPGLVSQPGNGYLYLQVKAEASTCSGIKNPDTGALVESNPADGKPGHTGFQYSYGAVEWNAWIPGVAPKGLACPKGGCLPDWPGLWSLSNTNANEIDTLEGDNTLGEACHAIHPPPGSEGPGGCLNTGYAGAWHTFGSEWEPGVVKYFYDGTQIGEVQQGGINATPQYLIMDMVQPGIKQPLVVPDEMTVDYVRVWQHPAPAVVTTEPSSVATPTATLNGTVNPVGLPTKYFFQYGTTTGYGSSTAEGELGATAGNTAVHAAITGLAPGTTYYYRIVATDSLGYASYGAPVAFVTQPPPTVTLTEPTNLTDAGVTVNATVNPDGLETHYRFEYGLTESYGLPPIEGNAGSGTSPVPESANITGLQANTTYHYRIVATSSAGTSSTAATFTTALTAKPGSLLEVGGNKYEFYRGTNGALDFWYWNGSTWASGWLGGAGAMVGTPAPVLEPSGKAYVFYRGTNGALDFWYWNGSTWASGWLGEANALAGNPVPTVWPSGKQYVFYRGTNGALDFWYWNGSTWASGWLGEANALAGDPSPVYEPSGTEYVFYRGTNGALDFWYWNGSTWASGWLGEANAMGGEPAPVVEPGGAQYVFYGGRNGALDYWYWNNAIWESGWLGGAGAL